MGSNDIVVYTLETVADVLKILEFKDIHAVPVSIQFVVHSFERNEKRMIADTSLYDNHFQTAKNHFQTANMNKDEIYSDEEIEQDENEEQASEEEEVQSQDENKVSSTEPIEKDNDQPRGKRKYSRRELEKNKQSTRKKKKLTIE